MKSQNSFLFLSTLIILCLFNLVFPAQSDDIIHHFSALNNDFFASYFNWNGRFGELLYTGFFAKYNDYIWLDILNAFIGTIFIFALFFLIFARFPKDKLDYLSFFFLCVMLINVIFSSLFLWLSGSFNYILGIGLILLFLIPYRLFWKNTNASPKNNKVLLTCLIPLGICAGWSSEHIGATVSLILFLSFGFAFYKKIKLPYWYYLGAISFWVGWLILFFSPGSAKRVLSALESGLLLSISDFIHMTLTDQTKLLNSTLNHFFSRGFAIFSFCFCLFFIIKQKYKNKIFIAFLCLSAVIVPFFGKFINTPIIIIFILYLAFCLARKNRKYQIFPILIGVWTLIGLSTFQLNGNIPWRAKLGDGLILATLMLLMFRDIYSTSTKQYLIEKGIKATLCLSIICCFINWSYVGYQWNQLNKEVHKQKSQGIKNIVVSKKYFYSFYHKDYNDPQNNPSWNDSLYSEGYAKHFYVKSFKIR